MKWRFRTQLKWERPGFELNFLFADKPGVKRREYGDPSRVRQHSMLFRASPASDVYCRDRNWLVRRWSETGIRLSSWAGRTYLYS
jgi:hypothetical protein